MNGETLSKAVRAYKVGCVMALSEMVGMDGTPNNNQLDASIEVGIRAAAKVIESALAGDMKLDAPALVGHTSFGKGIPWQTVIECAQRHFERKDDPKPTPEQIAEFRDVLLNSAATKGKSHE